MCSGLFGTVSSKGTVKNLTVNNVESTAAAAAGGIIGGNMGGAIKNCTVESADVHVLGDNTFKDDRIIQYDNAECGGLIVGGNCMGTISGCHAKGNVSAAGNEPVGLGGIGGCLVFANSIKDCSADVTITAEKAPHAVGGLWRLRGYCRQFCTRGYRQLLRNCYYECQGRNPHRRTCRHWPLLQRQ